MPMNRGLAGQVALVTGASRGIGRAVALSLGAAGCRVVVNYCRSGQEAKEVCRGIEAAGGRAMAVQADVAEEAQVKGLFAAAEQGFGPVDILVNNAGIAHFGLLTELSDAQWRRLLGVNLEGAFLCCREALGSMVARKRGSIINVASMWGLVGASCEVAYSASKGGLIALTKALAKEVGPSGIRVNCVAPGVIATEMNGNLSGAELAQLAEDTPLGRIGQPEEVAEAVLYLASAEFVTGVVLNVNGGFVI